LRDRENRLFAKGSLYDVLENQKRQATKAVSDVSSEQIHSGTDEQLIAHFQDRFSITPVTVFPDRAKKAMNECQFETRDSFTYDIRNGGSIMVPGIAVTVSMPFTGEVELFHVTPNTMTLSSICADVTKPGSDGVGWLTYKFKFNQHNATPETIQREIDSAINFTVETINFQQGQLAQFEHELQQVIQSAISSRRSRLGGIHEIARLLDIPVTAKLGMPSLTPIAVAKKVIRELPPIADAKQSRGFSITDHAYESILSAVRAQGRTFEKTPATFSKFDEEELRDVILGNLNTHFQGQATGETFRAKGKTDICIEQDNRAAFIGECKIWRGAKELTDGLRQLLGYLTWRDCKAALVVFNKDRSKFSEILEKAPTSLRESTDLFRGELKQTEPGEWQMTFKAPEDDGRVITVHLMVYNLYTIPRS
jgi:hypothetical protein